MGTVTNAAIIALAFAVIFHGLVELHKLSLQRKWVTNMALDLIGLAAEVAQETTVESGVIKAFNAVAAQYAASKNDPAAIQAISDNIESNISALSAAVAANTQTTPPPASTTASTAPVAGATTF